MRNITLILLFSIMLVQCTSITYCGSRMCGLTDAHTFCQFKEGPGKKCIGYTPATLSIEEKVRIIARLNKRRSEAARGMLPDLPTAGDMLKLQWVEDLAREAQLWADQCIPARIPYPEEHDKCRDLYSITVGQCVASVVGDAPGLRVESLVDMWYMQNSFYKENVSYYAPPNEDKNYYGDFAQIMWSRVFMFGCGRSRFLSPWHGKLETVERMVCNFAPSGPSPGHALWKVALPAKACPSRSRPDQNLAALCTFQHDLEETNDALNEMTLEQNFIIDALLQAENDSSSIYLENLDELYLATLKEAALDLNYSTNYEFDIKNSLQKSKRYDVLNNSTVSELNVIPRNFKKIIGRPQSYNIDELNINVESDPKETINYEESIDSSDNLQNDLDANYEPNHEIRTSSMVLNTADVYERSHTESWTRVIDEKIIDEDDETPFALLDLIVDKNRHNFTKNSTQFYYKNELNEYSFNSSSNSIKELQDALHQMEGIAAHIESSTSRKIRRELRNLTDGAEADLNDQKDVFLNSTEKPYNFNKTLDRGVVLKMILQNMPYVKEYKDRIINVATGSVSVTTSPLILYYLLSYLIIFIL